jgi:hypothetical protein
MTLNPFPLLKSNKMSCLNSKLQRRGRPKSGLPQIKSERDNKETSGDVRSDESLSHLQTTASKKVNSELEVNPGPKSSKKKREAMTSDPSVGNKKARISKEEAIEKGGVQRNLFHTGPPFICNGCGAVFHNNSACDRHANKCLYRHLFQNDYERPEFPCMHCNSTFVSTQLLDKHYKICNPKVLNTDLDMPTLQKEEPLKPNRTKKTLSNIPVLSPVHSEVNACQSPKVKAQCGKRKFSAKRKIFQAETEAVAATSDALDIKATKQIMSPVLTCPPEDSCSQSDSKVATEKKSNQKSKPPAKKPKIKKEKELSSTRKVPLKTKEPVLKQNKSSPEVLPIIPKKVLAKIGCQKKVPVKPQDKINSKAKKTSNSTAELTEHTVVPGKSTAKSRKTIVGSKGKTKVKEEPIISNDSSSDPKGKVKTDQTSTKSKTTGRQKPKNKPGKNVSLSPAQDGELVQDKSEVDKKVGRVPSKQKSKVQPKLSDEPVVSHSPKIVLIKKKKKVPTKLSKKSMARKRKFKKANAVKKKSTKKKINVKPATKGRTRKVLKVTEASVEPMDEESKPIQVTNDSILKCENAPVNQINEVCVNAENNSIGDDATLTTLPVEQSEPLEPTNVEVNVIQSEISQPQLPEAHNEISSEVLVATVEPLAQSTSVSNDTFSVESLWCEVCHKLYSSAFNLMKHRTSLKHRKNAELQSTEKAEIKSDLASTEVPASESCDSTANEKSKSLTNEKLNSTANDVLNSTAEQLDLYINSSVDDLDAKLNRLEDRVFKEHVAPPAPPPSPVDEPVQTTSAKATKRHRAYKRKSYRSKKRRKLVRTVDALPLALSAEPIIFKNELDVYPESPPTLSPVLSPVLPNDSLLETDLDNETEIPTMETMACASSIESEKEQEQTELQNIDSEQMKKNDENLSLEIGDPLMEMKEEEEKSKKNDCDTGNSEEIESLPSCDGAAVESPVNDKPTKESVPAEVTSMDEATENTTKADTSFHTTSMITSGSSTEFEKPPTIEKEASQCSGNSLENTEPQLRSSQAVKSSTPSEYSDYQSQLPYDWSSDNQCPNVPLPNEQPLPSGENWNYSNWNGWTPQVNPGMAWSGTYGQSTSNEAVSPETVAPVAPQNPSFGAILGTVHQVLEDGSSEYASSEYAANAQQAQDVINSYLMDPFGGQQFLEEIQQAMGATDEEMAMLQQLGQGSLASHEFVYDNNVSQNTSGEGESLQPLDNPDLIDLDNQGSSSASSDQQDTAQQPSLPLDDSTAIGR